MKAALIPDDERVDVIQVQLYDHARTWWQTEATCRPTTSWTEFKRRFLAKYFPRTVKVQMARQFMNLIQGSLSVDAYATEFSRLSRFAPNLVATEDDKARKFEDGLNFDLQHHVVSHHYPTFTEVVDAARKHEQITLRQRGVHQRQNIVGTKRPF